MADTNAELAAKLREALDHEYDLPYSDVLLHGNVVRKIIDALEATEGKAEAYVVDETAPVHTYLGDLCGNIGPRIGEDGHPHCRKRKGHDGQHQNWLGDGWGSVITW